MTAVVAIRECEKPAKHIHKSTMLLQKLCNSDVYGYKNNKTRSDAFMLYTFQHSLFPSYVTLTNRRHRCVVRFRIARKTNTKAVWFTDAYFYYFTGSCLHQRLTHTHFSFIIVLNKIIKQKPFLFFSGLFQMTHHIKERVISLLT